MSMDTSQSVKSLLKGAAKTGEVITLCYGGGSKPGAERKIVVAKVGDDDFSARDADPLSPASGHLGAKLFKLAKVIWIQNKAGQRLSGDFTEQAIRPICDNLNQLSSDYRDEFEAAGWNIIEREDFFGLSRFFKNGKPRKTPIVSVSYSESINLFMDMDTGEVIEEKVDPAKSRPWRVDSERFSMGKSYGKAERAIALFIEEARALTP